MNAHNPFDAKQDWTNPYCQNSSNDPMVDALLGNAYHVVRTVYCNLGNLKLLYDFLNQYGMVIGVNSEEELKALSTQVKYSRIYGFSRAGDRQVTDYLYVEGDRTGILPNDADATGSWITVATSGSSSGGTSSGEGAYIPWVYSNGSATGGETTINVPDGTVGVPFIIINGDMQYVGRGFEFDVDSLSVTLAQPLEEGDEVVFLLTGVPAVPDNPNINDWIQINWLYNNGAAVGGEQAITIPYTFQSIPAVYKNGLRLYKGLTTESYTIDPDNQRIFLTEPLTTNDRLIVQIGGEARVLEATDRTIQEVARAANVKDSEVILSTDTVHSLNNKKVIYNLDNQQIYVIPELPTNVYISSVAGNILTYIPGNIQVKLLTKKETDQITLWRDAGDVRGWGAKGDGVTDSTAAFLSALANHNRAYVPDGTFLVDTTAIDINLVHGEGYILTNAGIRISVQQFRHQMKMVQAKLMVPNFGFDNGTTDTSIYPGARNALQGIAVVEVNGVTKLFMSQRVAGGSWTATTRCRIVECELVVDGSTVPLVTYSGLLNIGHGIDLTARIENGEVYLYSSQSVDPAYPDDKAGKGYSRIHWRGSLTSQADVESFALWGQVGSGHRFEKYNRACVKISDDGKFLIMASSPVNAGAKRQIFVYDFKEVQNASDKLSVGPKYITEYSVPSEQNSNVLQGIMSDGRTLTINMGGTVTLSPNYIIDVGFDGTTEVRQEYEGALDQYGLSGILNNPTQGHPWRFEPEGICSYKGGRLVSIAEGWYATAKIVSWEGANWACITPKDTTGVPPSNGSYWIKTTKAATEGAWSSAVNYANTADFSHEVKTIYYIGPSLGLPQEKPLTSGINNRPDPSQVPTGQGSGATSIGFQWRNILTIRGWAAAINRYFDALQYDNSSRLRIYDSQEGADNTQYVSVQALFNSTIKALILRAGGASVTDSAVMRLHKRDDPTYPGYIVESTRATGEFSRETNDSGATRFASAAGSTPVTACRPDDGMMYGFEKSRNVNLWGIYRGIGSPEGVITAPRGSLYVAATGAPATLYVKESGSGNTGWVAK